MNKTELIEAVAEITDWPKAQATMAVTAILDSIADSLGSGEDVAITGFGTFQVQDRPARKGRNPQTGAEIDIPAKKQVKFKPGKNLRDKVSG